MHIGRPRGAPRREAHREEPSAHEPFSWMAIREHEQRRLDEHRHETRHKEQCQGRHRIRRREPGLDLGRADGRNTAIELVQQLHAQEERDEEERAAPGEGDDAGDGRARGPGRDVRGVR